MDIISQESRALGALSCDHWGFQHAHDIQHMVFNALTPWLCCLFPTKHTMLEILQHEGHSRPPHDLSEDQQMSLLQPRNRIDLVFSEGLKCGRNNLASHKLSDILVWKRP